MLTAMSSSDYASLTPDDLVTGEAVALDLAAATVFSRLASGALDVASTLALGFVVVFLAVVVSAHADAALQQVALVCSLVVTFLVYPTTVETLTRGRSLGKLAFGLRTVAAGIVVIFSAISGAYLAACSRSNSKVGRACLS